MNVPLIDVHNMIADRYEREGKDVVSTYFNNLRDPTHTNPRGAEVNASLVVAGLKTLKGRSFDVYLCDKGKAVPAAKYVIVNAPVYLRSPTQCRTTSTLRPFYGNT